MKRTYSEGEVTSDAVFFTGIEIEKTKFAGMKTLFVTGVQVFETILDRSVGFDHIFLGANHSITESNIEKFLSLVWKFILETNKCVTIDIDHSLASYIPTIPDRFVAIIRLHLPNVEKLVESNVYLKIDDSGFNATNQGVWVLPLDEVCKQNSLTKWEEYSNDELIK